MVKNRVRNRQRVSRGTAVLGTVPPAPIPATERRRATPRVVHPGDPRRPSAALIVTHNLEASSFPVPLPCAASGLSNPSSSRAAPAVVHRPAVVPRAPILPNPDPPRPSPPTTLHEPVGAPPRPKSSSRPRPPLPSPRASPPPRRAPSPRSPPPQIEPR